MAMLTKFVHELCSDEPGTANYHDFHVPNHMRLLLEEVGFHNGAIISRNAVFV